MILLTGIAFAQVPLEYRLLKKFRETGDTGTALFILNNYPEAVFIGELKVELSEILFKKGDTSRAKRMLEDIDLSKVRDEYGKRVMALWKKLTLPPKKLVLRFPELAREYISEVQLTSEERETVLKRLLRKGFYEDVLKFSGNFCLYKGIALQRLGRYEESLEVLKNCEDERSEVYALISYIKMDDLKGAERYVRWKDKGKLYFLLGWEFLKRGYYRKARRYISLSGFNYRRYFYIGLIDYIRGNFLLAYENFSEAERYVKGNRDKAQVYFWKFKVLKKLGFDELAYNYLKKSADLTGFYSAVARIYLGKRVYENPDYTFFDEREGRLAKELIAIKNLGFLYYMRLEAFKKVEKFTPEDIAYLVNADPYVAIKVAVKKFGVNSNIYKTVAFPIPFRSVVNRISDAHRIDPALIYAIMRQESLFDPIAISRSDAKGLMQLLDRTAQWTAKRTGYKLNNVFDVETNIYLGTAFLRYLLDLWKGDLVRAIASYNAGQGAVSRWIDYRDDYVFIETIPFNETRNYVKRVLWFYYIYREKLSDKAF